MPSTLNSRPPRRSRLAANRRAGPLGTVLASPALARLVAYFASQAGAPAVPEGDTPAPPHLRELLRVTGLGARSLAVELARLERLGVVRRAPDGRRVRWVLVADAPVWGALRHLAAVCEGLPVAVEPADERATALAAMPRPVTPGPGRRDHGALDERHRRLSVAVATRLREDPSHIARALERLRTRLAGDVGPARWALEQWRGLLEEALIEGPGRAALLDILESASEHATRLRQSSPFAGVLAQSERLAILASAAPEATR